MRKFKETYGKVDVLMKTDDASGSDLTEVMDAMSLTEHDHLYHHDHYVKGQPCRVRERMEGGDYTDEALKDAENDEEFEYIMKERERNRIIASLAHCIKGLSSRSLKKNGMEMRISDQGKNGDRWVIILGPHDMDEKQFDEMELYDACKEMGYTMKDTRVGFPYAEKGDDRKMFAVLMNNPRVVGATNKYVNGRDDVKVVKAPPSEPLTDAKKSEILKKYGYAMKDGKVVPISKAPKAEETAAQKYMRTVFSGGTALKNKTNAELLKEKKEREAAMSENVKAFIKELMEKK